MSTEIAVIETGGGLMPAMTIKSAVERRQMLVEFTKQIMTPGTDFGAVPGTDKPTLLKPGAEKLATFFHLYPKLVGAEETEDWTGAAHGGEPFFYYRYRYGLFHGDICICEAEGSCNSWESKYRWRKGERTCPDCGAAAIIKGKAEWGGGWLCFAKKGGCGAKFPAGDGRIESQQVGRVPNSDIFDQVNTLQKMAQKRALVAAVLLGVNASEFFTQDMEDLGPTIDADTGEVHETPKVQKKRAEPEPEPQPERTPEEKAERSALRTELAAHLQSLGLEGPAAAKWISHHYGVGNTSRLTTEQLHEAVAQAVAELDVDAEAGTQEVA